MAVTGPRITPNSFLATTVPAGESCPITIYFISGNPGLIGYYHTFLSLLASYLSSSSPSSQDKESSFHIYGSSLGGFEVGAESSKENGDENTAKKKEEPEPELYGLDQQIHLAESRLEAFLSTNCTTTVTTTTTTTGNVQNRPRVILIGHSVGAYIAMEILRRHREEQQQEEFSHASFDIVGGIMLFPTVVDIALSPAGKRLTVFYLFFFCCILLQNILLKLLCCL